MDHSTNVSKFSKDLEKFITEKIEKNIVEGISSYCSKNGFPVITSDGTDETKESIIKFIYNECFKTSTPKKSSPKKSKNSMLNHEQYENLVIEEKQKGNGVCSVIPARGEFKTDWHCGAVVSGASDQEKSKVRCPKCKDKRNFSLTDSYHSREIGTSVTVTLSPSFNSPVNGDESDEEKNEGDPVAAFLSGNTKGIVSPSLAIDEEIKVKDEVKDDDDDDDVPEMKMTKIKKTTKFCDYRFSFEEMEIIVRDNNGKKEFGGKFVGIKTYKGAYLDFVKDLSDEEKESLKKFNLKYNFIGTGEDVSDDDDNELDALLDGISLN
jgi:phage FluMu protein Com